MLDSLRPHGIVFLGLLVLGFLGCNKADDKQQTNSSASEVKDKQASDKGERTPLNFRGVLAKQSFKRAELLAEKWDSNASLRLVQANRWAVFGPSGSGDAGSIEIKEWRFTFVNPAAESRTYLVTPEQVKEDDKGEGELARSLPALSDWHIDVDQAIKVATGLGLEFASGPSLKMWSVQGKNIPIWVIPGRMYMPSDFLGVDARNGSIISLKDAIYLGS